MRMVGKTTIIPCKPNHNTARKSHRKASAVHRSTRSGYNYKTAAFWTMYIELIELYLLFNRFLTTNDLKRFTVCLGKLCTIFFATSCPNYTQWMSKYHLDLLYIHEAHLSACAMLERGAIYDEHPKNEKNRFHPFSKLVSARRRWILTRSTLSELISHLIEIQG